MQGRHAGEEDVVEPVLGVLANMTLRQPEIVERCASAGVVEWVLGVMAESPASSLVQRQACILVSAPPRALTHGRNPVQNRGTPILP